MSPNDVEIYRRRAVEERERAATADNAETANAHQELARHFENLVARAEMLTLTRKPAVNQNDPSTD